MKPTHRRTRGDRRGAGVRTVPRAVIGGVPRCRTTPGGCSLLARPSLGAIVRVTLQRAPLSARAGDRTARRPPRSRRMRPPRAVLTRCLPVRRESGRCSRAIQLFVQHQHSQPSALRPRARSGRQTICAPAPAAHRPRLARPAVSPGTLFTVSVTGIIHLYLSPVFAQNEFPPFAVCRWSLTMARTSGQREAARRARSGRSERMGASGQRGPGSCPPETVASTRPPPPRPPPTQHSSRVEPHTPRTSRAEPRRLVCPVRLSGRHPPHKGDPGGRSRPGGGRARLPSRTYSGGLR